MVLPNGNRVTILVTKKKYPPSIDDMYLLNDFDQVSIHTTILSTPRQGRENIFK